MRTFSRASCAACEVRAKGTVCARVEDGAAVVVEKCGEEMRARREGTTRARVKARMVGRGGNSGQYNAGEEGGGVCC